MTTITPREHAIRDYIARLHAAPGLSPEWKARELERMERLLAATPAQQARAAEDLAHILAEHGMGESGCDVPNDPDEGMQELWGEIQADPTGWHDRDHETHGQPFDVDHSTIEWGA